jgi:hypothetical protein
MTQMTEWEQHQRQKIIGDHWLEVALDRFKAGDPLDEVLLDYGYAPATTTSAEIARLKTENESLRHRLRSALKARNLWTDTP